MLTTEQRRALVQWKNLLADSGLESVLDRQPEDEPRVEIQEKFQVLALLFGEGRQIERRKVRACMESKLLAALAELGLVDCVEEAVSSPYRLVFHLGLWLFCEKASSTAKFYYGHDSIYLSRMLVGAQGRVLDLCSGVGTQALVCARTAEHVTAVEIEPLAAKLLWVNAAMNELTDKLELLHGDLLAPVAGRQFDVISCNPPFMPVPQGVRYPRFAGGGGDGLEIVRRLMAGLSEALAPDGRCEVVGTVLGTSDGPDLSVFKSMAAEQRLAIVVDCLTREELEGPTLQQLTDTAMAGGTQDVEAAFRSHFAAIHATHLFGFLLHAMRAPSPMVCASYKDAAGNTAFSVLPFF